MLASKPATTALRRLVGSSILYTLGDIASRALMFLLVPIWTHYLTPAEYGVFEMLRVGGLVLTSIAALSLSAAVVRQVVELERERFRRFYGSVALFQAGFVVVLLLVAELAGEPLFAALLDGIPYQPLGRLLVIAALLGVLPLAPMTLLLYRERPGTYVSLNLGLFTTKAALSLALVVGLRMGVAGLLWAELLAALLFMPVALVLIVRETRLAFELSSVTAALAYSLPLVPHSLAHLVLTSSDRYLIGIYHGAGAVGLYGVAYLFASGLTVGALALNKAMGPFVFQTCHELERLGGVRLPPGRPVGAEVQEQRSLLGTGIAMHHLAVGLAGLLMVVLAPEVVRYLMAQSYAAALPFIPWVVWGAALHGSYLMAVNFLFYYKRTVAAPLLSGGCAALNLGLNIWLVPRHGAMAAAVTTLICYLALAASVHGVARRCMDVPYPVRRLAVLVVVLVPAAAVGFLLDGLDHAGLRLAAKALLLLVATLLLAAGGFRSMLEPQRLIALLASRRQQGRGGPAPTRTVG